MTLLLDVPEEVENALRVEAARKGVPLNRYAVEVLAHSVAAKDQSEGDFALSADLTTRRAQIRALLTASPEVRAAAIRAGAAAMAEDYRNDPELTAVTDALADEDFYGFEDEDDAEEDEPATGGEHGP